MTQLPVKRSKSKADSPAVADGKAILAKHKLATPGEKLAQPRPPGSCHPETLWDLHRDGVTQGLLGRFLSCPEKHRLAMVEGLSGARTSGALAFGSLVHEALDKLYGQADREIVGGSEGKAKEQLLNGFLVDATLAAMEARDIKHLRLFPQASPTAEMEMEENYAVARVVLRAYFRHWASDLKQIKWLALEKKFEVPFSPRERLGLDVDDIPLRGKRDGDFLMGKKLWLFETKTKARIEEDNIIDTLSYDLQVCLYMLSMELEYHQVPEGCLYNIIRRPQLKQGKAETLRAFVDRIEKDIAARPEWYFVRYNVVILEEERQRWTYEFNQMMWRLIMWTQGMGHYRDKGACTGRMGTCEYIKVCGHQDFTQFLRREEVFPELAEGSES
jgi:hypothetical protein